MAINSRTKATLSETDLRRIAETLPGGRHLAGMTELKDGYFNTAYLLTFDNRSRQVLKVSPAEDTPILSYEKDLMKAEVAMMVRLEGERDIPVPKMIHADFSRSLIPHDFFTQSFLEGTPWNKLQRLLSREENESIEFRLGEICGILHSHTGKVFGYPGLSHSFTAWFDAFFEMMRLIIADAQVYSIELPVAGEIILSHLKEEMAVFRPVSVPCLVHWDLWPGNVFIRRDGDKPRISGIIDFERALWGDPLMEFMFHTMIEDNCHMKGYGTNPLANFDGKRRRLWYNIYLALNLIVETGPRQYEDNSTAKWGQDLFAGAWGRM
jgi:aminoglycoside phosphotransferase (APT) family kinase protein